MHSAKPFGEATFVPSDGRMVRPPLAASWEAHSRRVTNRETRDGAVWCDRGDGKLCEFRLFAKFRRPAGHARREASQPKPTTPSAIATNATLLLTFAFEGCSLSVR